MTELPDANEAALADVPRRTLRARVGSLAVDVTPLRASRSYRRVFFGEAISLLGSQMTQVALAVHVYRLTGSSFAVGVLGLVILVPLVTFGLLGGSIADARDRRRVLLITQTALLGLTAALTAATFVGVRHVVVLYAFAAVASALFAVDAPTRRAVTPRLLPADLLPAANGLGQVVFGVGFTLGPLVAGTVIAIGDLEWAYAIDTLSFVAALLAIRTLPAMPPEGGGRRAGVASVIEGLRYLRTRTEVLMTFVVDLIAMVFGMPKALYPALAATTFGGGPRTVGLLYAAPGAGALLGALVGGWFGRVRRQGAAVLWAVAVWGVAVTLFGLTDALWLAVVMLAVAGGADMVSAVFRTTILQAAVPDAMRGRLNGVFIVVVAGGPRLGDLEAGTVAALSSNRVSVVTGGLACLVGTAICALAVPSFRRYDAHEALAAMSAVDVGSVDVASSD